MPTEGRCLHRSLLRPLLFQIPLVIDDTPSECDIDTDRLSKKQRFKSSAGVAILWRHPLQVRPTPTSLCDQVYPHPMLKPRILFAILRIRKLSYLLVEAYLWAGECLSQGNLDLLYHISFVSRLLGMVTILCGDFQVDVAELSASCWHSASRLSLLSAKLLPTCGSRTIDHILVSSRVSCMFAAPSLLHIGRSDHTAVVLFLPARPLSLFALQPSRVSDIPAPDKKERPLEWLPTVWEQLGRKHLLIVLSFICSHLLLQLLMSFLQLIRVICSLLCLALQKGMLVALLALKIRIFLSTWAAVNHQSFITALLLSPDLARPLLQISCVPCWFQAVSHLSYAARWVRTGFQHS